MVALPVPTTAGMPSSRATMEAWDRGAPMSVTTAAAVGGSRFRRSRAGAVPLVPGSTLSPIRGALQRRAHGGVTRRLSNCQHLTATTAVRYWTSFACATRGLRGAVDPGLRPCDELVRDRAVRGRWMPPWSRSGTRQYSRLCPAAHRSSTYVSLISGYTTTSASPCPMSSGTPIGASGGFLQVLPERAGCRVGQYLYAVELLGQVLRRRNILRVELAQVGDPRAISRASGRTTSSNFTSG